MFNCILLMLLPTVLPTENMVHTVYDVYWQTQKVIVVLVLHLYLYFYILAAEDDLIYNK
jgi:hypothetical protein